MEGTGISKESAKSGLGLAGLVSAAVTYLGPAEVTAVGAEGATVRLTSGIETHAMAAFALPYEPALGDTLLVIGGPDGHYAIGVLAGHGRATLAVPGDLELHAQGGKLRLAGDSGVEIAGKSFDVLVDKMKVTAGDVVHKCASLYERVSKVFSAHHKQAHTVVDDESYTRAKRATVLTEETMTINGKQIHLG